MDESRQINSRFRTTTAQVGRQHALAFHPRFDDVFKDAFAENSKLELDIEEKKAPKSKASVRQLRQNERSQYVNPYTYEDTRPTSDVRLTDEEADMWDILSEF